MDIRTTITHLIATFAIAVFFSLGVHVASRNPRRKISWVFFALCWGIVNYYVTSLFLYPEFYPDAAQNIPFVLRLKWAGVVFAPILYFHLASFHFSPNWKPFKTIWIPLSYLISVSLAIAALFTDFVIEKAIVRDAPHIIGVEPGPLMIFIFLYLVINLGLGIAGLIDAYRKATFSAFRKHILLILLPTVVFLVTTMLNIIIVAGQNTNTIPHEISDIILICAGILFAISVIDYGSFVGRPVAHTDLFATIISIIFVLLGLGICQTLDLYVREYIDYRYPLFTGLFVIGTLIISSVFYPWLIARLDRSGMTKFSQYQHLVYSQLEQTSTISERERVQIGVLSMLCEALGLTGGYLASPRDELPKGTLNISSTFGDTLAEPGDPVQMPDLSDGKPQLVTALPREKSGLFRAQRILLVCPLAAGGEITGLMALGEKKDGKLFSARELALVVSLIQQVNTTEQIIEMRTTDQESEASQASPVQTLRQIEQRIFGSVIRLFADSGEMETGLPLNILVLGPMVVSRSGTLIPETEWASERAKMLLAFLLWRGEAGATRNELCKSLWPDQPIETAANVFHVTLHRLRKVLEPGLEKMRDSEFIHHNRGRYYFNREASYQTDLELFQKAADSHEVETLREAVSLYRGSYLQDVIWSLPPEIEAERHAIEQTYMKMLRTLILLLDETEAVPYLLRLRDIRPTDRGVNQSLRDIYKKQGRDDLINRLEAR